MKREEFDDVLRVCLRREPFVPFRVRLNSGEEIEIDDPNGLAFNAGGAAFLDASDGFSFFSFEQVANISPSV